jgi:sterol desaturase/sphingolipid hydroxylase (fatty acid hydroxylase superfamily)
MGKSMDERFASDLLIALTSGWSGFALYWALFMLVATAEMLRPSGNSRLVDGRIAANFGLGLMSAAILLLPFLSVYSAALFAHEKGWGLLNGVDMPFWVEAAISFLLLDLAAYLFHRASHKNRWLWRLHRVHHSDRAIDASTTLRTHPVALLILAPYQIAAILLMGLHPLGVLIFAFAKVLTAWISHADVAPAPRLSRLISLLIVTPGFHHRHHSAWHPETDSNYGEVLTIWDRLFGTQSSDARPVARYGLGDDYDRDAGALIGQLKLPFINPTTPSAPHSADM